MPFKAKKEKDATLIIFSKHEKWRSFLFVLFLISQTLLLWGFSLKYTGLTSILDISLLLSTLITSIILLFTFLVKSLKMRKENFSIEYKIGSLLLYKRSFRWEKLRKVSVEENRLKSHDILFATDKREFYLGESLDEEKSDALLKEIQLFHFYYL